MSLEFFEPVDEAIYGVSSLLPKQVLGKRIRIHTKRLGFPELKDGVRIALFSVDENRNGFFASTSYDINEFRRQFYQLYPGNWSVEVADLGGLPRGKTPEDSYFAIKEVCIDLRKMNIIPVIIGGSQDLTVAAYRSFENNNHLCIEYLHQQ